MTSNYPFKNTFLTQLMSINIKSREFPNTLTTMLASQEGINTAMSLQGNDALTLVDILDQAFEVPNMPLDLRRKSVRILRKVCGSQGILPRSCILSENISKEGDIAFASGGFTDVWKGRHNGNRVCIKAFRAYTAENLSKIKQRLFQNTVIWRRLSHPNVLPMLGVSRKLFPLCVITEWMINGNIVDFASKRPGVNRLHLLAEASQGLLYLHSIRIIHNRLKPENILIDRDGHPRLTDYGLPFRLDVVEGEFHHYDDLQYLAPELLDPSSFGLKNRIPTTKSDIFAFGMVAYQVLTEQQPFPGAKHSIIDNIVTGTRPYRPPGSNEWLSNNVWNLICGCWLTFWEGRPGANFMMDALNDAGDVIEFRRREPDLVAFLDAGKTGVRGGPVVKKAQEFVDMLDLALGSGDLAKRNRKQYLKHLRKLCGAFIILPSSFMLAPTLDKREAMPFDAGGSSDVYKATFEGRPVVIKTLRVVNAADPKKIHKLLVKEVVGWKWLRHDNILPFVGVMLIPPLISIVSEQMKNGNIVDFVRSHPKYNRLRLLVDAVTGLEYLHENDIVHGDLKGANILIDSNCRACLADFGLAVVIDESTANNREMRGTIRWMAPELMHPEGFGFTSEDQKRLPSRSTDTYALGMTILEVITGCRPFDDIHRDVTVMYKVLKGERPNRPSDGFSDQLWALLATTWLVERRSGPSKRPPISTILNRLREDVHNLGEPIIPPASVQPQSRLGSTYTVSGQLEEDASEDAQNVTARLTPLRPPQTGPDKTTQNSPGSLGIVAKFRGLILGLLLFSALVYCFKESPESFSRFLGFIVSLSRS